MIPAKFRSPVVPLIAICLLNACTRFDYEELDLQKQAMYFGTQPGYHKLSDYYSIDVDNRLMKFYSLGLSKKNKKLIGTVLTDWFNRSNYGPREAAYAISNDGKRLLFFDEPGAKGGSLFNRKHDVTVTNLYIIDIDRGRRQLIYPDVHRRGGSCIEFPSNYVRFGRVYSIGNIERFAYSTDGQEVSLEARSKRLSDSGNASKECGPL